MPNLALQEITKSNSPTSVQESPKILGVETPRSLIHNIKHFAQMHLLRTNSTLCRLC